MKLLILSQYFPPEVGAPQNRLFELAIRLKKQGYEIEVLTAMPNYPRMSVYEDYKGLLFSEESIQGIRVVRSFIYASPKTGIFVRLLNYFSFVFTSFFAGLRMKGDWDYIFCESPPLFIGWSAIFLSRFKKSSVIFNVSDLWPESAEKLNIVNNKILLNQAYKLEKWCYKNSDLITGQTQGIVKNINNRFPELETYWLPNGVDLDYYNPDKIEAKWRHENGYQKEDIILGYAGILGHAQGLEIIIEAAKHYEGFKRLKFVILGEGPERTKLLALVKKYGLTNLRLFNGVDKSDMPSIVASFDLAIVPLKKLDLFKGAIPSKIFELLAMRKPLILGVDGEARHLFIEKANAGWYYEPGDIKSLIEVIALAITKESEFEQIGLRARSFVEEHFDRNKIAQNLNNRLIQLKK